MLAQGPEDRKRLYAEFVIENGEFGRIPPCFSWADVYELIGVKESWWSSSQT